jgi:predicted nucleotidyltransferase
MTTTPPLPANVERVLGDFVEAARAAFGDRLASIVLFGSAAEGRMRATSDVNLIVVLTEFVPAQVKTLSPAAALAQAAIRLRPMFLLTGEIPDAAECFGLKFADVIRRHQILFGTNPFAHLEISRRTKITRLRQVLLNLVMRLRAGYAESAVQEDQVAAMVADAAGPLRTAASILLELETGSATPPKEGLQRIVDLSGNEQWRVALAAISDLREQKQPSTSPSDALFSVLDIAEHLRHRVESLHESV